MLLSDTASLPSNICSSHEATHMIDDTASSQDSQPFSEKWHPEIYYKIIDFSGEQVSYILKVSES